MAFSLFDHPHFSKLLQRLEIVELFSPAAELEAMLRFETALAEAEADLGLISGEASDAVAEAVARFQAQESELADGIAQDGLAIPTLVKCIRDTMPEAYRRHLHFGATSQDVIDTGLVLRLKQVLFFFRQDLETVSTTLNTLATEQGDTKVMGRTRMQRALPITFADRLAVWKGPLDRQRDDLDRLENVVLAVQFGGAVGTLDKLGDKGHLVRKALAERLGLTDHGRPWHAERDRIADFAGWLTKISGSAGKIGQDLALMAQNEVGEVELASGGSSSAMPHKRNPITAEILVTLARFNAGHLASIHHAMVHEGERSGSAWTLEWLILPEMVAATAASLKLLNESLSGLTVTAPD